MRIIIIVIPLIITLIITRIITIMILIYIYNKSNHNRCLVIRKNPVNVYIDVEFTHHDSWRFRISTASDLLGPALRIAFEGGRKSGEQVSSGA